MCEDKRLPRFLISGGGTGGHIFPALSIAAALRRRYPGCDILFVGAEDRMEMERVPAAGYDIVGLPVAGFDRRHLWRNFKVLLRLWKSYRMAKRIVSGFRPDVAIGVGGYASGPTLRAAQAAGVPTVIQEQNSYAGVTNKLLASRADAICVAYSGMERFFPADRIKMTGNPVRKNLSDNTVNAEDAKEALGFDPSKRLAVVIGGSLGARTLNNAMIKALGDGSAETAPFQVLWQTGARDAERCRRAEAEHSCANIKMTEFISDMATAYRAADLVVARAGAGTISELELLGKPCILVPSPNVAEDHQRHNAEALANVGAAGFVADSEAESRLWTDMATVIENPDTLKMLSENISRLAMPDSDEKIVDIIAAILDGKQS